MLQWFQRLLPRQQMFFPLFNQHAKLIEQAAIALKQMLDDGEDSLRHCRMVMEYEQQADEVTRKVLLGIRSSFITPFDRIDIRHLITAMDDTIDQMNKTAHAILLFEINRFEPEMRELGDIIVRSADLVCQAVPLLSEISRNATHLSELCVEISHTEDTGDKIYEKGLRSLYRRSRGGDAMDFIRGNEVYMRLDQVVDKFDDIGNLIQGIVVEHV